MTLPTSFNRAVKGLGTIDAPIEEKALLLNTVGRSTQSATLYLYFLKHRGEAVDPRDAGLPECTTNRLVKLFMLRGLIEKCGHRRGGNGFMYTIWRLT